MARDRVPPAQRSALSPEIAVAVASTKVQLPVDRVSRIAIGTASAGARNPSSLARSASTARLPAGRPNSSVHVRGRSAVLAVGSRRHAHLPAAASAGSKRASGACAIHSGFDRVCTGPPRWTKFSEP